MKILPKALSITDERTGETTTTDLISGTPEEILALLRAAAGDTD